jgi:hypothetical protein
MARRRFAPGVAIVALNEISPPKGKALENRNAQAALWFQSVELFV